MPGVLYHIYFGKLVYEQLTQKDLDLSKFMSGNILPDYAKNKKSVHHYHTDPKSHFYIPDLEAAKRRYSRLGDQSLRLGIYAHLWLDDYFTRRLLVKKFTLNPGLEIVSTLDGLSKWPLEKFFSFDGLYRAYSESNPLLLEQEDLSLDWIHESIPRDIPTTGISTLDDRIDDNWLDQLERRLDNPPTYTGKLITYDELVDCVFSAADAFISHIGKKTPHFDNSAFQSPINFVEADDNFIKLTHDLTLPWPDLRQGIIEVLLQNPNISSDHKGLVEDFTTTTCERYQAYRQFQQQSRAYSDASDLINQIAQNGANHYRSMADELRLKALDAVYTPDFLRRLSLSFQDLGNRSDILSWTSNKWVEPVIILLEAFASANGDLYRLIVSYSTF